MPAAKITDGFSGAVIVFGRFTVFCYCVGESRMFWYNLRVSLV